MSRPTLEERRTVAAAKKLLQEADALYASFSCPATAECCQLTKTGRQPWLWPSEWAVLKAHLSQTARPLPAPREDGGCPFLDGAGLRCTVYEARPFGCRTFFCHRRKGPAREPAEAVDALLRKLGQLSWTEDSVSVAPLPLLEWISKEPC